jgi:hypothetical protein
LNTRESVGIFIFLSPPSEKVDAQLASKKINITMGAGERDELDSRTTCASGNGISDCEIAEHSTARSHLRGVVECEWNRNADLDALSSSSLSLALL